MDLGIQGKGALVTGASSGLGFAAAMRLAQEGAEVVINSRSEDRLKQAAHKIENATGARVRRVALDLTPDGNAEKIAKRAAEQLPNGIDIVVSNTGGPPAGLFLDQPKERFSESADLLLHSAINLTRALLPGMLERKWGRMIYITSIAAIQPMEDLLLSNIYRAGLTGFCRTLASTYGMHGVTFNAVCPGYIATERLKELAKARAGSSGQTVDQVMATFAATTPAGRVGQPEELASIIAFLAGTHASFINGANIPVDGGKHRSLI
ncbi:MAG: SDR family oxidoreductase [candidate division Zixibacteria bacterium]|nr:SDR family oxidoreductase [candidate division Zixibacteria bacterium]